MFETTKAFYAYGATGKARTIIDVEKAAKLRTRDDSRRLTFERWKPFLGAAIDAQTGEETDLVVTMPQTHRRPHATCRRRLRNSMEPPKKKYKRGPKLKNEGQCTSEAPPGPWGT